MTDEPPPLTLLPGARPAGIPNPATRVPVTLAGVKFDAGNRTIAHVTATIERLAERHPDARFKIIKGCYTPGGKSDPSAGTHDGDGVLDIEIEGLTWKQAQKFMRKSGWAAWWRHTGKWAAEKDWHVHAISLGCPAKVGGWVPRQVDDYHNRAQGLAGQHDPDTDPTWHPKDIGATIFDYPSWALAHQDAGADA